MFNYQPYNPYQQMSYPQMQPQTQSSNSIQYVNGVDSARAYQILPNSSVLLMDSTMDRFYIKKSDASGFSTVDAYDFHRAEDKPIMTDFVSRQEFEDLRNKISQYEELLAQLK